MTSPNPRTGPGGVVVAALLTPLIFLLHGYHPYTEDGGLYVASVKWLLDRSLYPAYTAFVTQHLNLSLFPWLLAAFIRATHQPLDWVLLEVYALTAWATLWSVWVLADRLRLGREAQLGAALLVACWWSLPIAGTSLMLMDPYVTSRSLSTPLILLALAALLDALDERERKDPAQHTHNRRAFLRCSAFTLAALAMHPLMAGFGLATMLLLWLEARATVRRRILITSAIAVVLLTACWALYRLAPPASADEVLAVDSRYYWFPGDWHWFEVLGLLGPVVVLLLFLRAQPAGPGVRFIIRAILSLVTLALLVCVFFSHHGMANYRVPGLQPLRSFHLAYTIMIVLLGGWVGSTWLKRSTVRWVAATLLLGVPMFFVARATTPSSAHLELPGRPARNDWVRAFLWVRASAPREAVFAMDPHYITTDGEDAQGFRALAERSALPDFSKDGGEAGDTPSLAGVWHAGVVAQSGLEAMDDAARRTRLGPFGATWVILRAKSATLLACPYTNATVKVCRF